MYNTPQSSKFNRSSSAGLALIGLLSMLGCSQEPASAPTSAASVQTSTYISEEPGTSDMLAVANIDTSSPAETATPAEVQRAAPPEFTPPYPHRNNPFQQPNVEQVARSGMMESNGGFIELKGFIDVGKPRVLLAMDDRLQPLYEGDEWHGVKVIQIDEPQVILQRGRIRWTESLFDRFDEEVSIEASDSAPSSSDASDSENGT